MLAVVLHAVAALALWWLAEHAPTIAPKENPIEVTIERSPPKPPGHLRRRKPNRSRSRLHRLTRAEAAGRARGRQGNERPAVGRGAEGCRRTTAALARGDGAQAGGPAEAADRDRHGGAQSAVTRAAARSADPAALAEAGARSDGRTLAAPAQPAGRKAAARRGASAAAASGAATTLGSLHQQPAPSPLVAPRRPSEPPAVARHQDAPTPPRRRSSIRPTRMPARRRSRIISGRW